MHIFKHKLSLILQQNQDEDAVEFANRVKRKIAMAGGLVDLVWDGNLKRQVLPWNFYYVTMHNFRLSNQSGENRSKSSFQGG